MRILIAGLSATFTLGAAGHDITVIERISLPRLCLRQ